MWNTTEFGNPGGGYAQSGGGFFNTTTTGSPSSQDKKKGPDRLTNIMPCTIAQILQMPEEEESLKVGTMTAKIITFVGVVIGIDSQSTRMSFLVNDCSGPSIEVQVWVGENADMERRLRSIQENTYVRVTGAIRSMKGKRHVIAFKICPITDNNEITVHILEVIHAAKSIYNLDNNQNAGMSSNYNSTSMMDQTSTGAAARDFNCPGLTQTQQLVWKAISAKSDNDDKGVSIYDLFNSIKSLNRQQIKEAIEFLSTEGHIYTTLDEDHFKSTESM